jgi:hypothetical protein
MELLHTCPNCEGLLKIKEEFAGQAIPCPGCGHQVQVPESIEECDVPIMEGYFPSAKGWQRIGGIVALGIAGITVKWLLFGIMIKSIEMLIVFGVFAGITAAVKIDQAKQLQDKIKDMDTNEIKS